MLFGVWTVDSFCVLSLPCFFVIFSAEETYTEEAVGHGPGNTLDGGHTYANMAKSLPDDDFPRYSK